VGRVQSPPLVELLRHAVRRSDNQVTDGVFRTVGAALGDGSWSGSARAARQVLAPLRLDWEGARVADGSGLSREDRLTARFLTGLDRGMLGSNHGAQWRSLLAVSGERGTLRRRLTGTIAAGRLVGKTGTLKDVRSLVGHVEGPAGSGRRYHLAVVGNGLTSESNQQVRDLTDRLAILLAADLYGCNRGLVEPTPAAPPDPADPAAPPAAPAPPVETWVCAA
jgi:serine-type D-Ala-D-Ala carboxypeptidase/endopeptidase (penicillin-binding protein 4)